MGRCRCSFCNIRVSRVARACGFKDECTTQSMILAVGRFPFHTHAYILTSNNVIKFVLFLFCALSSLSSCCCLESTHAPAPAPATSTGPPPLPVPLSDLPAGLNATLINGFWYYYETKEGKVSSTLTFIFLFFVFFGVGSLLQERDIVMHPETGQSLVSLHSRVMCSPLQKHLYSCTCYPVLNLRIGILFCVFHKLMIYMLLCNFDVPAVDAMQSLFEAWSDTAANSFSYNLQGWSNRVGLNYPCFEKSNWQGVVCLHEQLPYNGTTPIFLVAVHYL
jgi:hypothetical protein